MVKTKKQEGKKYLYVTKSRVNMRPVIGSKILITERDGAPSFSCVSGDTVVLTKEHLKHKVLRDLVEAGNDRNSLRYFEELKKAPSRTIADEGPAVTESDGAPYIEDDEKEDTDKNGE